MEILKPQFLKQKFTVYSCQQSKTLKTGWLRCLLSTQLHSWLHILLRSELAELTILLRTETKISKQISSVFSRLYGVNSDFWINFELFNWGLFKVEFIKIRSRLTSTKGISSIKPEMGILRSLSSINKDFGNFGKPFNSRIFT